MVKTLFIVDEIEAVVAKVDVALQAINFGFTVRYDYGHPKEINQRLQELSDSPDSKDEKFPVIVLLTDIPIKRDIPGMYGTAKLRFIICNYTESTYTARQRTDINFRPILHPIKEMLIQKLTEHRQFVFEAAPSFTETDCYFYGSQINDKNVFNDRIDAIELSDLNVNITEKIC